MKKILLSLMVTSLIVFASQAMQRESVYTQPDGTTFKGTVKGLSQVNWIETNGEIVKYKFDDKTYYVIDVDTNGVITYLYKYSPRIQRNQAVNPVKKEEKLKRLHSLIQTKLAEDRNNR